MKKSEQAMMPDFFREEIEKTKRSVKKPKAGDDDLLLEIAESRGWELLKSMLEEMIQSIEESARKSVGRATTWEEVAKVYFARDVSVDSINSVISIVELRKEAKYAEQQLTKEE